MAPSVVLRDGKEFWEIFVLEGNRSSILEANKREIGIQPHLSARRSHASGCVLESFKDSHQFGHGIWLPQISGVVDENSHLSTLFEDYVCLDIHLKMFLFKL
jgi:hypothetical protein